MLIARILLWLVASGVAAWTLPWWAAAPLGFAGLWLVFRPLRDPMKEGMARSRGFALRAATVKVDGLTLEPLDAQTRRLRLDLTVRPRPGNSRVKPWWPGEFRFVPDVGKEVRPGSIEEKDGASWREVTAESLVGEQRLRLQLVVPARATRLKLRYFLEELVQVEVSGKGASG